tara:strand:- start:2204 stop:2653 length:450 start_codon:yes stop_codon:yes gene_type:complete
MQDVNSFSVKQAARFSGLTLVMVNYLCRTGVLEPSGSNARGRGRRREYTFSDIVILKSLKRLLDSGIGVSKLKRALNALRREYPEISRDKLPAKLRYLVTNGETIYLRRKPDALQAMDGSDQFEFAFVINLAQIHTEVFQAIRAQGGQK